MSATPTLQPPSPLRLRRLTLGWTQDQLARFANVSRVQVVRLEAGRAKPRLDTAQRLALAVMCDVEDLFPAGGTEDDRVSGD